MCRARRADQHRQPAADGQLVAELYPEAQPVVPASPGSLVVAVPEAVISQDDGTRRQFALQSQNRRCLADARRSMCKHAAILRSIERGEDASSVRRPDAMRGRREARRRGQELPLGVDLKGREYVGSLDRRAGSLGKRSFAHEVGDRERGVAEVVEHVLRERVRDRELLLGAGCRPPCSSNPERAGNR